MPPQIKQDLNRSGEHLTLPGCNVINFADFDVQRMGDDRLPQRLRELLARQSVRANAQKRPW